VGQLFAKAKAVIGQLDDGYRAAVCGSYRSLFIYCPLNHCMKLELALDFKGLYHSKGQSIGIRTLQFSVAFFWSVHFFDFSRKYET
jgi:hypothetical protein